MAEPPTLREVEEPMAQGVSLVGRGRILRLGRALALAEVTVEGVDGAAVAHEVGIYALPAVASA